MEESLEEYLLKDIVEIMQKGISQTDANIITMVDDFTNWNPNHAKADILIHYAGNDPENEGEILEENEIQVYLFARTYIGQWGVLAYNQAIKKALKGKRSVFAADKLKFGGCKFQGTKGTVWNYVSTFTVKVNSCANVKELLEKKKNLPKSI